LTHPPYQKPELMATAPNQLWSWDITKLLGPAKWTYFYLYVILDVFSRHADSLIMPTINGTENVLRQRQDVLDVAYQLHPERFVRSAPKPPALTSEVWISKPVSTPEPLPVGEGR
jgi:putative transposase